MITNNNICVNEYFGSAAELLRPKKRPKIENLSSITIGYLETCKGSIKSKYWKRMKVLFDSSCGATLVNYSLVNKLKTTKERKIKWKTKSSSFYTNKKCKIKFSLPAFHEHRKITWNCCVD